MVYSFTALGGDLGEMIIPVAYTANEWKSTSFAPFYKNVEREGKLFMSLTDEERAILVSLEYEKSKSRRG